MLNKPLIILGMGNGLFGDDGAGIVAAEILREHLTEFPEVVLETTSWGGFRIIDLFEGFSSAIVIDAIQTGKKPLGFIHQFSHADLINSVRMVSFHDINFATAIEFAKSLNINMPTDITVYAIEIEQVNEFSEGLTSIIQQSVEDCVHLIINRLSDELHLKINFEQKVIKI